MNATVVDQQQNRAGYGAWYSPWFIQQNIQNRTGLRAKQLNTWCVCFWIILAIAFGFAIVLIGIMLSYATDTVYKYPLFPWTNYQSVLLRYQPKLLVNILELDFSLVTKGFPTKVYFFSGTDPTLLPNTYNVHYNISSFRFEDSYATPTVSVAYQYFLMNRQSTVTANIFVNSTNSIDLYRVFLFNSAQIQLFLDGVQLYPEFAQPIASYTFTVNSSRSISFTSQYGDIFYFVFVMPQSTRSNLLNVALNYVVDYSTYSIPIDSVVSTCEFTGPSLSNVCTIPSSFYSILVQSTQPPGSYQDTLENSVVTYSEYANWSAIIGYFIGIVVFFVLVMTASFLLLFLLAFIERIKRRRIIDTDSASTIQPPSTSNIAPSDRISSSYGVPPIDPTFKTNIQPSNIDGTVVDHDIYDYVPQTSSSSNTMEGTFVNLYPNNIGEPDTLQNSAPVVAYQSTSSQNDFK